MSRGCTLWRRDGGTLETRVRPVGPPAAHRSRATGSTTLRRLDHLLGAALLVAAILAPVPGAAQGGSSRAR